MIKKIVLLKSTNSQYDVQAHFTQKLYEVLRESGIDCRLQDINDSEFSLYSLLQDPPDCTMSFNGVAPDAKGRLLFDVLGLPHVSIIIDSVANNFLYLTKSPYSILACVDRTSVDFLKGIGFENCLFLPHAIENSLRFDPHKQKNYDIAFLGTCIDYEAIEASWNEHPKMLQKVMHQAAEISLSDSSTPCYQALTESLDNELRVNKNLDVRTINIIDLLDQIELYVRGKDRIELIKAIKAAPVNLFGSGNWKKYLGDQKNVVIHPGVPFKEALQILQSSKIVLNSCPQFKYGSHERLLYGLAGGAVVMSNKNTYLSEQFEEGKSILFYQYPHWENINSVLEAYLTDEDKRMRFAKQGFDAVMNAHTWQHRVAQLLQELPPLITKIKSRSPK